MKDCLRSRFSTAKSHAIVRLEEKAHRDGWKLERQSTTFANEEGTWSNIDSDVTPLERRTWGSWSLLSFWCSDALNAQGWEAPSAIIAAGLTWKEAIYLSITGGMVDAIPLMLNGAIGAHYHIPYPIVARACFGFNLSRFAVITRMATALFWHAIQAWTGSTAMFQIIRAIWPTFLNIPNHLPESAGITSNQMIAHFVFFCVQFPILLTPPHKLKWFFAFKTFIVPVVSIATVVTMVRKAGGVGDIWHQDYQSSGSARSWIILNNFSSQCGGWGTMATNIPDFTRYMKRSRGLAIFLAPIAALLCTDYWLVKKCNLDVPALYRRRNRYWYTGGVNWRAAVAFLVAVIPNIPGLAKSVNPSIFINDRIQHIYDLNYLYGFCSAAIVYYAVNVAFPARQTLLDSPIYEDIIIQDGIEVVNDGAQLRSEEETKKHVDAVAIPDLSPN
ncbi:hypothetical protein QM012_003291 [Aureobasidium pullulans]|uniref:Allantoin permease n=1 Tax=Aureobasidium pullulans TaxID=5580 RepID=A0ABR0T998_AURPU